MQNVVSTNHVEFGSEQARPVDRTPSEEVGRPGYRAEAGAPAHRGGTDRRRIGAWVTSEKFPQFVRTRSGLFRPLERSLRCLLYPFTHSKETNAGEEDFMSRMALTVIALCAMALVIPANTVCADEVLDWNAHAAKAIVTVGGQVPPRALIRLAMVHLAIYDAVNAIEGAPFEGYASVPAVDRPASEEAATAAAAHDVLVALFPAQVADLDAKYAASLAALPDGSAKANGIVVGQRAASAILTKRAEDGRDASVIYTPGSGPGVWVPTPPAFL